MTPWRIIDLLSLDETTHSVEQAYAREVRWSQGNRINLDTRLLLLGVRRLLTGRKLGETQLREAAWVLGCRMGAMDSYERFDDSLRQGQAMPLSFAYALPSMPLACVSVCHGVRGLTYTVTGGPAAGIRAFTQALDLIDTGVADTVVTGAWESPSATAGAGADSCRLLLAVVQAGCDSEWQGAPADEYAATSAGGPVESLERFLRPMVSAQPVRGAHA